MHTTHELTVEHSHAPYRLDHYLAEHIATLSRSRLQSLVKDGHITLNGAAAKQNIKLRTGDKIVVIEPAAVASETLAEDIPLDILYEDDDLIVVNKPPGLVVHPAVGHLTGTLVNALLHHCKSLSGIGGVERPGIVHRLDKETSGCLVAAKNDHSHHHLAEQFAGREITKIYLALVAGRLTKRTGSIKEPIGRHRVNRQKMAINDEGRPAHTDWRVIREISGTTLVECTLHTGRTHQIRVHLKHLGFPILGDEVYGKRGPYERHLLHAWKLGFAHPRDGRRLDFTAGLPEDFKKAGVESV